MNHGARLRRPNLLRLWRRTCRQRNIICNLVRGRSRCSLGRERGGGGRRGGLPKREDSLTNGVGRQRRLLTTRPFLRWRRLSLRTSRCSRLRGAEDAPTPKRVRSRFDATKQATATTATHTKSRRAGGGSKEFGRSGGCGRRRRLEDRFGLRRVRQQRS